MSVRPAADGPAPALSVVVASYRRPLRLRWLLNALQDQTFTDFEVLVGYYGGQDTEAVLAGHPLAAAGVLRWRAAAPGVGASRPGANRNSALALARAPVVVITDDDCRPPPGWLAQVAAAVAREPGAVIQGPVLPDPVEAAMQRSRRHRSQWFIDVPRPWAECANIVYPRAAIDRFREDVRVGEDTDLCLRVRAAGVPYVGDPEIWTWHAVDAGGLLGALRRVSRWTDLPELFATHPELRAQLPLGVFWKPSHGWLVALLATPGLRARGWRRTARLLALAGWLSGRGWRAPGTRRRLRVAAGLPGDAVLELAEVAVLMRGSWRSRTVVL